MQHHYFDGNNKGPLYQTPTVPSAPSCRRDEVSLALCHVLNCCLAEEPIHPQSSSASRFTAGAAGFLLLIQCRDRPESQLNVDPYQNPTSTLVAN
jgi:hypothetical protein